MTDNPPNTIGATWDALPSHTELDSIRHRAETLPALSTPDAQQLARDTLALLDVLDVLLPGLASRRYADGYVDGFRDCQTGAANV